MLVNGALADKVARLVAPGDAVTMLGDGPRFVSRGGEKLDAALVAFEIDVSGLAVLDAGASTGGFTDCLLQRGARQVFAVDVGHGQLHPRIRNDDRVVVFERFHIRDATPDRIGAVVDMVVADLSFISLRRVIAAITGVCAPGGTLVLLVKPQFEAGRVEVSRGRGVIVDPAIHERVRGEIDASLVEHGCTVVGWIDSPITGGDGNRELLVHATTAPAAGGAS